MRKQYLYRPLRVTTFGVYPNDIIKWRDTVGVHVAMVNRVIDGPRDDDSLDITIVGRVTTTDRRGRPVTNGKRATKRVIDRHTIVEVIGTFD